MYKSEKREAAAIVNFNLHIDTSLGTNDYDI